MMAAEKTQHWRGELRYDEPMARHNSWRAGGSARCFYKPADVADLCEFLRQLDPQEPLLWLGLGSNLLVRDGGFPGTVIFTLGALTELAWLDATTLRAGAGVTCAKLARVSAQQGLTGLEFLAGIPGTLGGALAMNAGAFGGETWGIVASVESIDRNGQVRRRPVTDFTIGYRSVKGPENEWFLSAELELSPDAPDAVEARIKSLLKRRSDTQPMGYRSCGSVFRNPPGDYAARLIEASGLKGHRVGDAAVSEKHANFILNLGAATAEDVETLIGLVRERVTRDHGVELVTEVHIVGDALPTTEADTSGSGAV